MKKILLTVLFMANMLAMSAVPAQKVWRTHQQTDGTQLSLILCGDENFHYFKTTDGHAVVKESNGYYYATTSGNQLLSSGILAHEPSQRTTEETAALATLGSNDMPAIHRIAANQPQMTHLRKVGTPTTYTGSKKGLVLLV